MKKFLLLLISVALPLLMQAQTAMTLDKMSEKQIDRILNYSKKAVLHCCRYMEQGRDLPQEQYSEETFTLIYDYPNGGCDFYVKGEKYAYFLSRPMNAKKMYTDKNDYHMLTYIFNGESNYNLSFNLFTYKGNMYQPQMVWRNNDKVINAYMISSVDFYDTSGQLIASTYVPKLASDIDTGNLWQCWLDKAYQRYR